VSVPACGFYLLIGSVMSDIQYARGANGLDWHVRSRR
jgi:hypothetical protein